jgi:DNA-binding NarL/FixJ family response regulator
MEGQIHPEQLRLMILSDQVLFRTSLARLLACETGFNVIQECGSSDEALAYLKESPVDIALLDFIIGADRVEHLISSAHGDHYQGKFLIMAESSDVDMLTAVLGLGASGVFQKSEAPDRLVLAIRLVSAGAVWVDQNVIQLLAANRIDSSNQSANRKLGGRLGEQEAEVIRGVMQGLTTKTIGSNMGVSEGKVKNILQGLFARTGVRKRSQLVRLALEGSLGTDSAHGTRGRSANYQPII